MIGSIEGLGSTESTTGPTSPVPLRGEDGPNRVPRQADVGLSTQEERAARHDRGSWRALEPTGLLLHGLQVERHRALSDLPAGREPVVAGAAEMNAREDSGVGAFPGRLREARERARDALERLAAHGLERDLVSENGREHRRGRRAEHAL